jgi:hypothetical protein
MTAAAHELTRAEESQAISLIPAMLEEIRAQRAIIESMSSRLPSPLVIGERAAELCGVRDARTVRARFPEAVIHVGRKILFDTAKLRPTAPADIARLADAARAGR